MNSTTYTNARKNFKAVLDEVCENHITYTVKRRKGGNAVIVSEQDYKSLEETAYLLSTPKNVEHLTKSLQELEDGDVVEFSLD